MEESTELVALKFTHSDNMSPRVDEFSECFQSPHFEDTFDYIIVGGGSAGSILAGRLVEDLNVSVLLIEAGGTGYKIFDIPVIGPLKQLSELDWQHSTVPQNHSCLGLENNISKWPGGKILGGSTHLNYMIYLKGHEKDYAKWKDPETNHWDYNDVSSYFKKSAQFIYLNKNDNDTHFEKGSIIVRKYSSYSTDLSDAVLQAAAELGFKVDDLNSNDGTGFMKPQLNIHDSGQRWTSDNYLKPNRRKNKLRILENAVAEKILLRDGFEAYGVRYKRCGKIKTAFAKKEVIVSAGTVGSAKLLMLSGIGPKTELEKAHVTSRVDLPVGKNLQDHVTTGLDLIILKETLFSFLDLMVPSSAYQYFIHGTGPFTSGLVEAVGVVHSTLADPLDQSPDLEFMVLMAGASSDKGIFFQDCLGISNKVWEDYFSSLINETVVSILPVLLHPKSLGEITLDEKNPKGKPKINPRYLTHEDDVRTLVEGIRIIQKMVETTAFKNLGIRFNLKKFPGCEFLKFDSDDYWGCYVRHLTLTVFHPVGTCKMGELKDGGVVDHRLRVYKTNKLRVIDASIMPSMPSANTNAAVVMIAEKGVDLIKEDFYNRFSSCRTREVFIEPNICFNPILRHNSF